MDARREPRFSIYGPVKVKVLSSPDRVIDCSLQDISATGLKLIAPETLPLDDILSIEAEDHLALAEVRYSQPRGDKFTVGCDRIHVLSKVSLPEDQAQIDQIRLLIDDYRNRIRDGIAAPRPDINAAEAAEFDRQLQQRFAKPEPKPEKAPPPPPAEAKPQPPINPAILTTHDQLVHAAAAWVVEHWEKIPPQPKEQPAGRSEILDRLTYHLAHQLRPPAPVSPAAPVPASAQPANKPVRKNKSKKNPWTIPLGIAAAVLLGWGLSALFWSLHSSGIASNLPSSIAALISPKDPAPAPASSVRHAQIKVSEPTWVQATSDGKRLFNKKLVKNDVKDIDFSDKALLRVGNAKGVEITLDGKSIGPIGVRGEPRIVELNATGFRLLPLN
jgi:hypothetical protein